MQIAMLGPLDVRTGDGTPCPIAGARLSRLLIILAIRPRAVVPTPAIVDAVWGDAPPGELAVGSIDAPVLACALVGLADVALTDGDGTMAARILGASTAIRGMPDLSHVDGIRVADATRTAIGPEAFEKARHRSVTWSASPCRS